MALIRNALGLLFAFFAFLFLTVQSHAQTFVGTFVAVKGDVKILRTPASDDDKGPFALYENQKFIYESAKIGKKIKPTEIVQSGADGKAKIVYPNGDHFILGQGTTMVMPSVADPASGNNSAIKIIFGRVRSLISKKGPRNNMKVTTPAAVAGVRGTDFFTRSNPTVGTEITVLRGEVTVQNVSKPEKTISVKTGFTAETKPKSEAPPKMVTASKEDLKLLQEETTVPIEAKDSADLTQEQKVEVAKLEDKTKEAILSDIKNEDQALYNELKENKNIKPEEINDAVISKLFKAAPHSKKRKISDKEYESIGDDIYKKNFNQ